MEDNKDWFVKIDSRLTKIEKTVEDILTTTRRGQRTARLQFIFGLGITAMAVGMALVAATPNEITGLFLFGVGLIISVLSFLKI